MMIIKRSIKTSCTRFYAATSAQEVFNSSIKRLQKNTAAQNKSKSRSTDGLKDHVADLLIERASLLHEKKFSNVLDIGSGPGHLFKAYRRHLKESPDVEQYKPMQFEKFTMADYAENLLLRDKDSEEQIEGTELHYHPYPESYLVPEVEKGSFDLILSNMFLHWVNDVPGFFVKISQLLKDNGIFIASALGGDTLFELRTSLQLAEMERYGRGATRISPMIEPSTLSSLVAHSPLTLPTIDTETVVVSYPDALSIMSDLRYMGESNAVTNVSESPIPRDVLLATEAIYQEVHKLETGDTANDGSLNASFDVIFVIAWKKGQNQPEALERGSGQINMKEFFRDQDRK